MKIKKLTVASLLIGPAFLAQQASAQWTLVDNLTAQPTGNLTGLTAADGGTWDGLGTASSVVIGSSVTAGNAAITASGGLDGADYIALPTSIGVGATATIFFQFDLGSSITANNVNWSVENIGTATDGGGSSAQDVTELNANAPNRAGVTIRNGGSFAQMYASSGADSGIDFVPVGDTMYDAWMVVNNNTQTYQLYLAGGTLGASPILMDLGSAGGSSTGAMRNAVSGGSAVAIDDFIFGTGGTGDTTTQGLYDLYEASGMLTTDPIPEPSTMALFGALGAVLVALRRRNSQV